MLGNTGGYLIKLILQVQSIAQQQATSNKQQGTK
jgi:hypothetical protein